MKKDMIIRAWKDPEFRARLSPEERAALPDSPVGHTLTELEEHALADAVGGYPDPDHVGPIPTWLSPVIRGEDFIRIKQIDFQVPVLKKF